VSVHSKLQKRNTCTNINCYACTYIHNQSQWCYPPLNTIQHVFTH